jgi:quinol monooxygenase YgiN
VWRDIKALKAHFSTSDVRRFVIESASFEAGNMDVQFLTMCRLCAIGPNDRSCKP